MSIKNAISNNGINSATFNGKNYTRREVNGVVFYDITSSSSGATSGGGANVTTSDTLPASGSDGDLWYDETSGGLYVYTDSINGWIQTNGGGGSSSGASVNVSDDAPSGASQGDLWYDSTTGSLYIWMAGSTNAWIQTNGGSSSGASLSTGSTVPDNPGDGDLWFDESVSELYAYIESQSAWIQTNGGSSGGGSGPRAYVTFDAETIVVPYTNDITHGITNSYNVASITDGGVGIYYVDFTSPILDPLATYSVGPCEANNFSLTYPERHQIRYFASTSSTSGTRSDLGGSIARIFIGVQSQRDDPYRDAKFISLVVH
jgi:hypothetical protein